MLTAQVEAFLEIARQGSVSRAAEILNVTQPALTARIQGLETELGSPLFVRNRRGMALTDPGRAFLPYAERAMAALHDGMSLLHEMRQGGTGELVIGAAPAVSTYVLPPLLARYTARHQRVRLVVRTGHSEEILGMALRREIDIGFVRELRHPDIDSTPLYEDVLVLVAHPDDPIAHETDAHIAVDDLARTRLILFDRTSSYFDLTNTFFRQAGVAPAGVMELDNIDAAIQMVEQGLGVALLPHTAVSGELADGRLRSVAIEGVEPIRRRIVAIRRRDLGPPTHPVEAFLEILGTVAEVVSGIRPGRAS
jgi:DNA-binding transcriptional LysR family regulator